MSGNRQRCYSVAHVHYPSVPTIDAGGFENAFRGNGQNNFKKTNSIRKSTKMLLYSVAHVQYTTPTTLLPLLFRLVPTDEFVWGARRGSILVELLRACCSSVAFKKLRKLKAVLSHNFRACCSQPGTPTEPTYYTHHALQEVSPNFLTRRLVLRFAHRGSWLSPNS